MADKPLFVVYTRRKFNIDAEYYVKNIVPLLCDQFNFSSPEEYSLVALVDKEKRVLNPEKKLNEQGVSIADGRLELIRKKDIDGSYVLKRQFSVRKSEVRLPLIIGKGEGSLSSNPSRTVGRSFSLVFLC